MDPVLRIHQLSKTYRRGRRPVVAVDGVSADVEAGSIAGLLGPNGAGKTTTIKCALGLVEPTSGTIEIAGIDVRRHRGQALRHVGAVLEGSRNVFGYLTAHENLLFFANLAGLATRDARPHALALLQEFGLEEKADTQVGMLSRGMQQKVAICAALIRRPRLLLLDEPTLGLDLETAHGMRGLLLGLAREQGCAVVVSSHQLDLVEAICERVIILRHGRTLADERVSHLLQLFATRSYRFRSEQPLSDAAIERIAARFPTAHIEMNGASTTVDATVDDGQALYAILDIVRDDGCTVASIEHRTPDLEQVFMRLLRETPV